MSKLKKEETGSISQSERQKLQRLYTQGGAADESVRNLVKASNLSVSKLRPFFAFETFLYKANSCHTWIQANEGIC